MFCVLCSVFCVLCSVYSSNNNNVFTLPLSFLLLCLVGPGWDNIWALREPCGLAEHFSCKLALILDQENYNVCLIMSYVSHLQEIILVNKKTSKMI